MAAWVTRGSDRAGRKRGGAPDPVARHVGTYARPGQHRGCVIAPLMGLLFASSYGCGGGAGASIQPPPPPAPDYAIGFSPSSVSVSQGGTSAPVTLTVSALNGFSGSVQVALTGLPSGVTSNPASPFTLQAGANTQVLFGADASTPAGNVTISAETTSGNLSHSTSLSLSIQPGVSPALPRTTFVRTEAFATVDDPPGEPHHRHIAYDAANKRVFVANRAMNRVEVFSSADVTNLAQIGVSGASSADLSADGKTIWVGTVTSEVAAIDSSALQVRSLLSVPSVQPLPNVTFDRPEEAVPLSSGKLLLRLRQASGTQALLALWDPSSNSLTNLTSVSLGLFQKGVGVLARTGDHNKVFVAGNDSSGEIAVFDGNGTMVAGPVSLGTGIILYAAASQDGARFAVAISAGGNTQIRLLDSGLNQVGSYVAGNPLGLAFSRDSLELFVAESISGAPLLTVLSAADLHLIGRVPDAAIQGVRSEIEEADETQMVFAIGNRGVSFVDAAHPGNLPFAAPSFANAPVAQPSEGPNIGGTAVTLTGQNFENSAQIKFGAQIAGSAQVTGSTQIQAVSPASTRNGAVRVAAYFPTGWLAIAPDAFSYGPQIREVLPNEGNKSGGDTVFLYGYGFGSDPSKLSVKIGGVGASVQKVETLTSVAGALNLDATFPFPVQRITVQTPAGVSGAADIIVNSPAGTTTLARGFQYLQNMQVYPKAGFYKFVLYDQARQWVYLGSTDHVDVFDLNTAQFRGAIQPPGGPPPSAQLRGLTLTPDGSRLVIADFGAQSIYLMNPDLGSGVSVFVGGVSGFLNSGPARLAATSAQTVFVALSGEGGAGGCTTCLAQMNLSASPPSVQPAPQPQISMLTGAPLLQSTADGSRVFLSFGSAPGGPLAAWDSSSSGQFTTSLANAAAMDLAAAADGAQFALRRNDSLEIRSHDLRVVADAAASELERIPARTEVPGLAVHPAGALLYVPFLTGPAPANFPITGVQGGVDIIDAHSGRLRSRVFLPEPFAMLSADNDGLHGGFLATDENGQRLFALTASGLTVMQLASVPLGIGTVNPLNGPAAGGTSVTIRGSGFQSGIKVTVGGKTATAAFKDVNTLTFVVPSLTAGSQQIVLTNPNGETYSLDAAFLAQ